MYFEYTRALTTKSFIPFTGRVFSFLATGEAVFPICGSIILTKIFTASLNTTPNMAYLTAVISLLLPLSTFMYVYKVVF